MHRSDRSKEVESTSPSRYTVLSEIQEGEEEQEEGEIAEKSGTVDSSSYSEVDAPSIMLKPKSGASQKKKMGRGSMLSPTENRASHPIIPTKSPSHGGTNDHVVYFCMEYPRFQQNAQT